MKEDFFKYQAQTTPHPLALEISHAKGSYIYDIKGNPYLDFIAGVSACPLGHKHPKIIQAIKKQLDHYMHVMVYGEFIQKPAVELTKLLAENLPCHLTKTYLTNSGTEAIEGALKLAKRVTKRSEVIAAHHGYHGNTMGAMSVMGFEDRKQVFRPLLPGTKFIQFNAVDDISLITEKTACVILETIQGGAGFITPKKEYLKKIRKRCDEIGTLLILDEIQPGIGRTGCLFAFEHYECIPDILVIGKGLGGGMPIGAFIASEKHMDALKDNPKLGHITTFGGHPVIAASALATLKEITSSNIMNNVIEKEKLFRTLLIHPLILEIRGRGLMLALIMPSKEITDTLIQKCKSQGLLLFWLLFETTAVRITPPLNISNEDIVKGCDIIINLLNDLNKD